MSDLSLAQKPADADQKKRRSLQPLKRLLPYLLQNKGLLVAACIALVVAAISTLVVPVALRRVIGSGLLGQDPATINTYFLAMLGVVVVLACASASRYYFVTRIGELTVNSIRKDVFASVLNFDAAYFDQARTGEVISRLTADTTQIKSAVGATASVALRNILLFVGAIAMMVATSPKLSGLVVAAIPLIVIPLVILGRYVRKRSREAQDRLADASAFATEMIGSVRTIQSYSVGAHIRQRFDGVVDEAFKAAAASVSARAILTLLLIFVVFSSVLGIVWVGAHSVMSGDLTTPLLIQFLIYAVFAAGALGSLSEVWGEVQQTAGATERLMELIAERPVIVAPENPVHVEAGKIVFDNVAFAYPGATDVTIISDFSLTIKPGETVALVGPSGAGKSTVFSLLARFYDPVSGKISVNGIDIRDSNPEQLRELFALVPQDPVIFNDNVAGNINFGAAEDVSDDEIVQAAKAARADVFIEKMQDGYNTVVGERGVTLSGGQKQRIAIARAILRDAPILLLDEATSALDAESEAHVQEALDSLMEGRTTLIIAHRLATILKADRILVMDEGRVVDEGTHDELVAKGGLYARLAKLQFNDRINLAAE